LSFGDTGGVMAISPDGQRIAVILRDTRNVTHLYTRALEQSQLNMLSGTEGASAPFFSPDGGWVGFAADGKIKKVPWSGGAVSVVCSAPAPRGASWGDDGYIVFTSSSASHLERVPASGGTPVALTTRTPSEGTHRWPFVLPGSKAALFTIASSGGVTDDALIDAVSIKSGERKTLVQGYSPAYVTAGGSARLLYLNQNRLYAVAFDPDRLTVQGTPSLILDGVSAHVAGGGIFSASRNGTILYLPGAANGGNWTIAWLDPSGKASPIQGPGAYFTPRLSPDGKRLAYAANSGKGIQLWVKDLERNAAAPLTFTAGTNSFPVWTPDGKTILYTSNDPSALGHYTVRADGGGERQRLTDGTQSSFITSISPDGRFLCFSGTGTTSDIHVAPIQHDGAQIKLGKDEIFAAGPALHVYGYGAFSPDGRWIAYTSRETGAPEIFVRPFPGPGGKWQISSGGGTFPVWSRAGRELLYKGPDDRIMTVSYTINGDTLTAGSPRVWSPTPIMTYGNFNVWDLAPDGKRALVFISDAQQKSLTHLTLVLNLFEHIGGAK
jgi:serine/threonine-protein kinase